ncbi:MULTISPECIES: acetylornithine transaminase [Luteococcus]|uniref:Acetylornithine aminotransferase n=2 Tax=Luteococcus japonicus TaxID=33984 RepID=A0A1R4JFI7_9ACTN|nr:MULTISPECIES: acetylornithine transaminase [Luteococcus]SJN30523.1 Acetylornithine aminotransferase [Luteococcus japonicus LSP_Lj1]
MNQLASIADTTAGQAELLGRYGDVMMNTFGAPKRVFVRGEGVHVWDADGKRYLDLLSGIAVNALGHAHPTVLAAITSQLSTLGHVSNFFATPSQIALAEKLAAIATVNSPELPAKVFFTNSGTEANEAAFKATRLTGRRRIVAMEGSFHGRTMGALAITSSEKYRKPFEPLPGDVVFVPFGDVEALRAAVDQTVAAVVLEPVQGENGVIPAPDGYLAAAREITTQQGALLWVDEVQTGMGRCGSWLAHTPSGITADLVTMAKGLGNGFPIGACIATGRAAELFTPGSHGTTFGGNPVAAIAGLAVFGVIERDGLLEHVTQAGEHLAEQVMALGHPAIKQVRGRGLLRGIVLADERAAATNEALLEAGFITNAPRSDVLRIAPPLITSSEQLDSFVSALPAALDAAAPSGNGRG